MTSKLKQISYHTMYLLGIELLIQCFFIYIYRKPLIMSLSNLFKLNILFSIFLNLFKLDISLYSHEKLDEKLVNEIYYRLFVAV